MKKAFASNRHIHALCSPLITIESQGDIAEMISSKASVHSNHSLQKLMLEAVEEGLSSLGKTSKQAIYLYLETTFKIKKQDIALKIEKFTEAIEEIIGPGAKLLEIEIMKQLYRKIGQNFKYSSKQKNLTFTEYLTATHTFLCNKTNSSRNRNTLCLPNTR